MPLNCAIIDDDALSSTLIETYCSKVSEIEVRAVFHDPMKAIQELRENPVELIFLDVRMPGLTGFGLLDSLEYRPMVIMITGEEDHAYQAFEYQVIDFLKKPVGFQRFRQSIQKALTWYNQSAASPVSDVFIRHQGELIKIPFAQITYVQAVGDYIKIFTSEKNYLIQSTLKSFEDKLSDRLFVKAHRSYLVNIAKVQQVTGQKLMVQQKDIPISRSQKAEVYKKLNIL